MRFSYAKNDTGFWHAVWPEEGGRLPTLCRSYLPPQETLPELPGVLHEDYCAVCLRTIEKAERDREAYQKLSNADLVKRIFDSTWVDARISLTRLEHAVMHEELERRLAGWLADPEPGEAVTSAAKLAAEIALGDRLVAVLESTAMAALKANAELAKENARLIEELNLYQPAVGLALTLLSHVKDLNENGYDMRDYDGAQAPGWSGLSDQIWSFVEDAGAAAPPAQPQKEAQ